MGRIKTWNKWANAHTYYWLDIIRIGLGLFLIIKGVSFMSNLELLVTVMEPFKNWPSSWLIMHYVVTAHFVGGLFIVLGLLTRWAVFLQLPILIGAVATHIIGAFDPTQLAIAVAALLLCGFFFFYGSGKHSADYYLKMQK